MRHRQAVQAAVVGVFCYFVLLYVHQVMDLSAIYKEVQVSLDFDLCLFREMIICHHDILKFRWLTKRAGLISWFSSMSFFVVDGLGCSIGH